MSSEKRVNDSVHWYMSELTSRIVAESGIPSDRFHLGKIILQSLKDAPDFILQIDGATDISETNWSVLKRTVRCATALRNFGLKHGDVIVLMAPNNIDIAIPFYAALYLGVAISTVDRKLTVKELCDNFSITKPKVIFCQSEKASAIQISINELDVDAKIVTFEKEDLNSLSMFLKKYSDDTNIEDFRATDFNTDETIALLIPTSGTTGLPKVVASSHKNVCVAVPYFWSRSYTFPNPTSLVLIATTLQWLTAVINFILSPILRYTRLQTSLDFTKEHAYFLINTYKPSFSILSPTFMTPLVRAIDRDQCDFSSFETILLGGSAVATELIEEIKSLSPKTEVFIGFGMTEGNGLCFDPNEVLGACGKPMGCFQYRLIDIQTQKDIREPNNPGELCLKGPTIFKGYYGNPSATQETFTEDGWLKTGDLFYRDENWNFFFVDRIKLLLKYKNNQISPIEVEGVIRGHPDILDVVVIGIPDRDCGDLIVACVVRRPGSGISAQEIKDLVKGEFILTRPCVPDVAVTDTLTDSKQLRGGVVFLKEFPLTPSTKIHRTKLKEMVANMNRE